MPELEECFIMAASQNIPDDTHIHRDDSTHEDASGQPETPAQDVLVTADNEDEFISLCSLNREHDPIIQTKRVYGWQIRDHVGVSGEMIEKAGVLLHAASHARTKSSPVHSKFEVGASLLLQRGEETIAGPKGANIEYGGHGYGMGDTRALHAEEAAVADAINNYGLAITPEGDNHIAMVATITIAPVPSPSCGNCLDILSAYSKPETLIVSGSISNKVADIRSLGACLPDNFRKLTFEDLKSTAYHTLQRVIEAAPNAINYLSSETHGNRIAGVLTGKGLYLGIQYDQADYHSTTAIRDAILTALKSDNPRDIGGIFVVSRDGHITGRDRQSIFELAQATKTENFFPVYMYATDTEKLSVAFPNELSPFGFGATDLGLRNEIQAAFRSLRKFKTFIPDTELARSRR